MKGLKHEIQVAPPLLSLGGKLHLGTKADLLDCLGLEEIQYTGSPAVDAKLLDGAAVVHMFDLGTERTFQEYLELVFLPYVSNQQTTAMTVDTLCDVTFQIARKALPGKREERHLKGSGSNTQT